ncbi:hypothetical protein D3C76_1373960 [compost metagenome]
MPAIGGCNPPTSAGLAPEQSGIVDHQALLVHFQHRLESAAFQVLVQVMVSIVAGITLAHPSRLQPGRFQEHHVQLGTLAIFQL